MPVVKVVLLIFIFAAAPLCVADNATFKERILYIESVKDNDAEQAQLLLNKLAEHLPTASQGERVRFYQNQAEVFNQLGLYKQAIEIADQGLTLANSLGKPSRCLQLLYYSRGYAYEVQGQLDAAENDYERGLSFSRILDDQESIASGLTDLGAVYYQTYRYEESIKTLNEALQIAQELQDQQLLAYVYNVLGVLYGNINKEQRSINYYQRSYDIYKSLEQPLEALGLARNIGIAYINSEEHDKAIFILTGSNRVG